MGLKDFIDYHPTGCLPDTPIDTDDEWLPLFKIFAGIVSEELIVFKKEEIFNIHNIHKIYKVYRVYKVITLFLQIKKHPV